MRTGRIGPPGRTAGKHSLLACGLWLSLLVCGLCSPAERGALVALYRATGGGDWRHRDGWLGTNTSHCEGWFGVRCEDGQVAALQLGQNDLAGELPAELTRLPQLTELEVFGNSLSGTVPTGLASLSQLTVLSLGINYLSGTVPTELARLSQLTLVNLGINFLSGTVPAELARLSQLSHLALSTNSLSGTVPTELASLSQLTQLSLSAVSQPSDLFFMANSLSGTVPAELGRLSQLKQLSLSWNSLSGTVPAALGQLSQLNWLGLQSNRLSGPVPVALAGLSEIGWFALQANRLSGTVPAALKSLAQLRTFELHTNSLSGTLPIELFSFARLEVFNLGENRLSGTVSAVMSQLTQLTHIYLEANRLSGSVPAELASLTGLMRLDLAACRLSGTLPPELARLSSRLNELDVAINRLSGTIPSDLTSLTRLTMLLLDRNSLSGTVPPQLTRLSLLSILRLQRNAISGHIPDPLPTSLEQLMLHQNKLNGPLPSFAELNRLRCLTVFDNNLRGRLKLPQDAPQLQVLVAHRNRLSCPVEYNSSSYDLADHGARYEHGALIAPGNRLSSAGQPSWALTSDVKSQWTEPFWREWQLEFCFAAVGAVGTALAVGVLLRSEWRSFFRFDPTGSYEQLAWLYVKLLFGLSLAGLGCLVPVYTAGAGEFECGQSWLKPTLSYLSSSRTPELAASVLLCGLFAAQAAVANVVRSYTCTRCHCNRTEAVTGSVSWKRWLAIAVVWPSAVLVFSVPSFLTTLAKSVPGDSNTLGLSQSVLDIFAVAISPLLSLIDWKLVPMTVRGLVGEQGSYLAVGLMLTARFLILLVVPTVAAVVLGSDCYGLWITVWEPCQSSAHFNMFYTEPAYTVKRGDFVLSFSSTTTPVTQHAEVCSTRSPSHDRCPRFVIEAVAQLIVSKQIFTVFVCPLITVLFSLPSVVAARRWLMQVLLCREYAHKLDLDRELVLLSMVLDEVLVLGLVAPVVLPLGCLVVASRLAAVHLVTHRLGVEFKHGQCSYPEAGYHLWVSLLLGALLLLWFYIGNAASISGELIIYVGIPAVLLIGAGWAWCVQDRRDGVVQVMLQPVGADDYLLFEEKEEPSN